MPPEQLGPRKQILRAAGEEVARIDGERPDSVTVDIDGRKRSRSTKIHIETESGELAALLGLTPRLDDDELGILRALARSGERLMSHAIARALNIDEENSSLRLRLAPGAPLRADGYIDHVRGDGYAITDRGRQALQAVDEP